MDGNASLFITPLYRARGCSAWPILLLNISLIKTRDDPYNTVKNMHIHTWKNPASHLRSQSHTHLAMNPS